MIFQIISYLSTHKHYASGKVWSCMKNIEEKIAKNQQQNSEAAHPHLFCYFM